MNSKNAIIRAHHISIVQHKLANDIIADIGTFGNRSIAENIYIELRKALTKRTDERFAAIFDARYRFVQPDSYAGIIRE